tara:strand:+ start:163 stop:327 length:165 start_codon:yes stop_codon:yes gene_type:complete
MEGPESATGVLITCGIIFFLSGCVIIRVLHALDDADMDDADMDDADMYEAEEEE